MTEYVVAPAVGKYIATIYVKAGDEWYEAALTSDEPFTEAEIDDFVEVVKPILKEQGFMKDE
jgi:hypothetical protein